MVTRRQLDRLEGQLKPLNANGEYKVYLQHRDGTITGKGECYSSRQEFEASTNDKDHNVLLVRSKKGDDF